MFAVDEELEKTRSRFGNQKGISSDEFFGRERFDPNAQSEAKQRLREFDGAASISSNAYFGRPEEELAPEDNSYGDLESAAKDFVRRFGITAGDDLENFTHLLGEGATKLQGMFYFFYWNIVDGNRLLLKRKYILQVLSRVTSTVKLIRKQSNTTFDCNVFKRLDNRQFVHEYEILKMV